MENYDKVMKAVERYLELKDYEILYNGREDGSLDLDFIAEDLDGDIHGIYVRENEEPEFNDILRRGFEYSMAMFLADYDGECRVVPDIITVVIVGDSKAFIKHHINVD